MNKISKKIVSLVTMAAFVLTLVPAAAFANTAVPAKTSVSITNEDKTVTVDPKNGTDINVTLDVAESEAGGYWYVWLTDEDGVAYRAATVSNLNAPENSNVKLDATQTSGTWAGRAILWTDGNNPGVAAGTYTLTFTVKDAGTYKVNAGVDFQKQSSSDTTPADIATTCTSADTMTVNAAEAVVDTVTITGSGTTKVDPKNNEMTFAQTPNGINAENIVVTVDSKYVDAEEGTPAPSSEGTEITVVNPYKNIHVMQDGKDVTEPVKADKNGKAQFAIVADYGIASGVYTLKFTAGDVTQELKVVINKDVVAQTINAVKMDNNVVSNETTGTLENAVQFVVKDADGNELNLSEIGTTAVKVIAAPDAYDSASAHITLAETEDGVITLNTDKVLPVGEYTVRVAIANGDNADATFVVQKFGKAVELKLVASNADVEKSGEVAMGTNDNAYYEIKPVWVDEDGVTKPATGVNVGLKAGTDSRVRYNNNGYQTLVIPRLIDNGSTEDNSSLIGATVTVQAVDATNGFTVSRDFTIVDPANTAGVALAFDSENGSVEKNNKVEVTIVDADGNKTEIPDGAVVNAYVADKSNEDAYVQVTPSTYNDGKATLTVYSDKETTADIVVSIVDESASNNSVIYGGTLKYTFGEKDINADKIVAMTIGSTDMVVDNNIVTGDAAPYVADGRTMVPIRALTETFGAEVNYDNDARTVTIKDGDTTVVMTIGETTYTVNGEEQTMDVAPVIGSSDRTYVPVRFVAEALGYKVTPLYAADNTTASVVFQK